LKNFPLLIALALPILACFHIAEEYLFSLTSWINIFLNSDFSVSDFLTINIIGLIIFSTNSILHFLKIGSNFVTAIFGSLLAINGILHILLSLLTVTYVAGTITGIIFYLPLGYMLYKHLFPLLSNVERKSAIPIAVLLHVGIIAITTNI